MNEPVSIDIHGLTNQYFQLSELTVFNWGPFSGSHRIELSSRLSLIAGQSGSGKSSLIDAYVTMLNGNEAIFNMAAAKGKKHDRTLATYVRGARAQDISGNNIYERNGATASAIQVKLICIDGRVINLLGFFLFVSDATSTSEMRKFYLIDQTPSCSLMDYLAMFNNSFSNDDSLKKLKAYANHPANRIEIYDTFKAYQSSLLQHLQLDDARGLKLIGMAMGTKSIDNITDLMRRFALSDDAIESQAQDFISSFDDVYKIRESILETEEQIKILSPLEGHCKNRQKNIEELTKAEAIADSFDVYQLHYRIGENQDGLDSTQTQRDSELSAQTELENVLDNQEHTLEKYKKELWLKGGQQLETLEKETLVLESGLPEKEKKSQLFSKVCEELNQKNPLNETEYNVVKSVFRNAEATFETQKKSLDEQNTQLAINLNELELSIEKATKELEALKKSSAALPGEYLTLREVLIDTLDIDEENLKYVAEMVNVKDEEHEWQGAIERAIGETRFTLLCSQEDYRPITEWVNKNHIGLKLRVENTGINVRARDFIDGTYLKKLQWRDHPFREYVKAILSHKQFTCVDNISALRNTEYSITQQGSIQFAYGTFFKNDTYRINDRSRWYTGFDNERRKAILEEEISSLENKNETLNTSKIELDKQRKSLSTNFADLSSVSYFTWDDINTTEVKARISANKATIEALKDASSVLSKLSNLKQKTLEQVRETRESIDHKKIIVAKLNAQIEAFELEIQSLEKDLDGRTISKEASCEVESFILNNQLSIENEVARKKVLISLQEAITRYTANVSDQVKSIEKVLSRFADKYQTHQYPQMHGTDVLSSPHYLNLLKQLVDEDLPSLKDDFVDYLNNEVMHDAAALQERANDIIEDVEERIYDINQILSRCDFGETSYLKIDYVFKHSDVVLDFNRLCKRVKKLELDLDAEKQFRAIERLIAFIQEHMDKAAVMARNELFIPKYRLTFMVHETDKVSGEPVDTLTSTGSKSGGEKESFSASVLAACLAYTLRPDGWEKPALTTLFLDEAFSNTSIALAHRAMNLFEQLGLQANLITPMKNFELAEELVDTIFLTNKDSEVFSSSLTEIAWEALKEQADAYA